MNRALTTVTELLLSGSAGAYADSEENADYTRLPEAANESSVESSERSYQHSEKSEVHDSRGHKAQQGRDLGTMGTGNTGTTGGMGATTGTDTIGGTIEE